MNLEHSSVEGKGDGARGVTLFNTVTTIAVALGGVGFKSPARPKKRMNFADLERNYGYDRYSSNNGLKKLNAKYAMR